MVQVIDRLTSELADNAELFDMAKEEGDEQGMQSIEGEAAKVAVEVEKMEFRRMFNNPADPLNCFLDVQSARGAQRPATGPACCCASTSNTPSAKALKPP